MLTKLKLISARRVGSEVYLPRTPLSSSQLLGAWSLGNCTLWSVELAVEWETRNLLDG